MPRYTFHYEFYSQSRGSLEIEADTLEAAMEAADEAGCDEVEFFVDFEASTPTRLHSVNVGEDQVACISVPESFWKWSWIDLSLWQQWEKAADDPPSDAAKAEFDATVQAYLMALPPEISDEARAEVQASKLRAQTPAASAPTRPIRK